MRPLLAFLAVFLALAQAGYGQFGGLTKAFDKVKTFSDLKITEEDERALGEEISRRIREIYGVQQDPETTRYVSLVGRVVAERSDRSKLDYRFIILDSDSTNAFAAPGGFIHITRGALAIMKSEAELAGVLAHEIAHVTEKHTIKGLQKGKGIELAEGQTSLTGNAEVFQMIAAKATEAVLQGFSRAEELDADEEGLDVAVKAKYHPGGLPQFLESLQSRYSEREARAGLFASHPEIKERIEKLEKRIQNQKLERKASILLSERFSKEINYELAAFTGTGEGVEGARGMAGAEAKKDTSAKEEKKDEKSSGGFLSALKNPFGSGKKQERAEVTGSAAARGVETELGLEEPGDPSVVEVSISAADLKAFKEAGGLA